MKNAESSEKLVFDAKIYSGEAVKLAAYLFAGRAGIKISARGGATEVLIARDGDLARLAGEFSNEVLNQQCRLDLSRKNSKISGILATKALLSAAGETKI